MVASTGTTTLVVINNNTINHNCVDRGISQGDIGFGIRCLIAVIVVVFRNQPWDQGYRPIKKPLHVDLFQMMFELML
jgi:hypothetical protein